MDFSIGSKVSEIKPDVFPPGTTIGISPRSAPQAALAEGLVVLYRRAQRRRDAQRSSDGRRANLPERVVSMIASFASPILYGVRISASVTNSSG